MMCTSLIPRPLRLGGGEAENEARYICTWTIASRGITPSTQPHILHLLPETRNHIRKSLHLQPLPSFCFTFPYCMRTWEDILTLGALASYPGSLWVGNRDPPSLGTRLSQGQRSAWFSVSRAFVFSLVYQCTVCVDLVRSWIKVVLMNIIMCIKVFTGWP